MRSMKRYLAMPFVVCITMFMFLSSGIDFVAQTLSEETVTGNSSRLELSEFELSRVYNESNYENDFMPGEVIVGMKSTIAENQSISNIVKLLNAVEVRDCYGKTITIEGNVDEVDELKNSSDELSLKESASSETRKNIENSRAVYTLKLSSNTRESVLEAIEMLKKEDSVAYAEPNYIMSPSVVPSDYENYSLWNLDKIQVQQAWIQTTGSEMVKVGVLDTGFEYTHTDLASNMDRSLAYNAATGNDGYTADVSASPGHGGLYGHGTHVAGIIGAIGDNDIGITGINWKVSIIPMKICISDSDSDTTMTLVKDAVLYASSIGLPIINLSYGIFFTQSLFDAISEYSGLVVIAAGNEAQDNDISLTYGSFSSLDNVIFVANSTSSDVLYSTSNYGDVTVDLVAPGTGIYSTIPGNSYDRKTGTSMAAPHVTGVAALIKSRYPDLTATQIKAAIMEGVTPVAALSGKCVTGGRLNALNALQIAQGLSENVSVTGDFNGDGKDDWALVQSYPQSQTVVQVRPSIGNVYATDSVWWDSGLGNFNLSAVQNNVCAGDFNGDGKDDIAMMYDYGNSQAIVYVLLSQGSSFSSQVWYAWSAGAFNANSVTGRFTAGDVNGDGKDDIVMMYDYGNSQATVYAMISQGSSFSNQIWYAWSAGGFNANSVAERFTADDLNGDGKDDVAMMYDYGNNRATVYALISQGSSFSNQVWYAWSAGGFNANSVTGRFTAGDFNGDGKDDVAMMYDYGNNQATVYALISQGSSFSNQVWYSWSAGTFNANAVTGRFTAGDFNVDGKDDILSNYLYSYGTIKSFVQYSTGSGFTDIQEWSRNYD